MRLSAFVLVAGVLGACTPAGSRSESATTLPSATAAASTPASVTSSAPSASAAPSAAIVLSGPPVWTHGYPWAPVGSTTNLQGRISTDAGFTRVPVTDGTFAAFLRTLPLRDKGTPVVSFKGDTILEPNDPRLTAVVAIDVGDKDLQQCADSIIRMHAEWRFAADRKDVSYKSLSGFKMDYDRYRKGERFVLSGKDLAWTTGARADDSHAAFRTYLDGVFMWANTQALARDAMKVARADVRAGDFFVLGGAPGHTVLILDIETDAAGHKRALIGQGYMPAQSFHVVRAADGSPWFSLDGDTVATPFWVPFPWDSLRRME